MAKSMAAPRARPIKMKEERKYQVEDALRTIRRAEEIKADKPLMRDVKRMATTEQKALEKIKTIKR